MATTDVFATNDGQVGRVSDNQTWDSLKTGAGTRIGTASSSVAALLRASHTTDKWYYMDYGLFQFDTSALPDTDTISEATVGMYGDSGAIGDTDWSTGIVLTGADAYGTRDITDYNPDFSTTKLSDSHHFATTWSESGYNVFTLDTNGINNIDKVGISYFSCIPNAIIDGEPTWIDFGIVHYKILNSLASGTANDPYISITHSAGAPSQNSNFLAFM